MKKISTKQARLNRAVAKIKASKTGGCVLCGNPYVDAAHLLPKSVWP